MTNEALPEWIEMPPEEFEEAKERIKKFIIGLVIVCIIIWTIFFLNIFDRVAIFTFGIVITILMIFLIYKISSESSNVPFLLLPMNPNEFKKAINDTENTMKELKLKFILKNLDQNKFTYVLPKSNLNIIISKVSLFDKIKTLIPSPLSGAICILNIDEKNWTEAKKIQKLIDDRFNKMNIV